MSTQLLPRPDGSAARTRREPPAPAPAPQKLYEKRKAIHPKLVHGRHRTLKWAAMILLLGIYYLTPLIRWDRGVGRPDQAVLIDFEHRRFYFFWIELWPQEIYLITGLLIAAALGLFLANALVGRIWCGYACPQTVWTDLFIHIERLVEGDRNARLRLAKAPWTAGKIGKKIVKHAGWIAVAAATGGAWVFYFGDAPTLFVDIFSGKASVATYLFIGVLTFTTYSLAGIMREQVCDYMCPWPRIQAAMTDKDALTVTYRADRGEPRGPHRKGDAWEGRGDCLDCGACVVACPQGIDIRDGDQLACIDCGLCIDACDEIMTKAGRPKGLIAYDSSLNVARRARGEKARYRFVRPRTILYGALFTLVGGLMLFQLATRDTMRLDVVADRSPPFVRLSDGSIRNSYQIKIVNMQAEPRAVRVELVGLDGARISAMGGPSGRALDVVAKGDAVTTVRAHVVRPAQAPQQPERYAMRVLERATGEQIAVSDAAFVTGGSK